jgi:DNA mismatch endonuclease (patch repair protein)
MSAIKTKNTKPEIWIRKRLHAKGFRYRLNVRELPGKPDIVLPKYKAVIFVNGCFWHMHDCPLFVLPKSRTSWWKEKLTKNKQRDQNNINKLQEQNWRVVVIWECAIRGKNRLDGDSLISEVTDWIHSSVDTKEIVGNH